VTVGIAYLDGPRLARSLFAASDWVAAGRDEINRINVFPVPDGDTGTNFSLTLRSVADALRSQGAAPLGETARTMARAAVLGARGNSGMMLAHFLLGVAEAIEHRPNATVRDLAQAVRRGAEHLHNSIDDPREGTILTVARHAAEEAQRAATDSSDIALFLRRMLTGAQRALEKTPELLAVLKEAGVVDAGGKGFVRMIEGMVRLIEGDPIQPAERVSDENVPVAVLVPAAAALVEAERDFQFCTEVLIQGNAFPPANQVRAQLRQFGGSIVVAEAMDVLKIHVHTDDPDAVFEYAARWGTIESTKAEDMRVQHRRLSHETRRAVGVVADSSADLSDVLLDRHGIALIPLQVTFGDETFRDRVELTPAEFFRRLRTSQEVPTTSQPTPAEFVHVLRDARAEAEEVVAVLLSSALSGTFQSAQAAIRAAGLEGIHLVDSRSASLGLGLLALRAAELAESGWPADRIVGELGRIRDRSGILLTVDQFDNLLRSGRVGRGKAWLAGKLDIKPILALDQQGAVVPLDRVRGRVNVLPRMLGLLTERLTPRPKRFRLGVVHVDVPDVAEEVRSALVDAFAPHDCLVAPATPALATHVGPGAWAVCYQVEDDDRPEEASSAEDHG
jgi:DAK2 domain fusion protein YloV